LEPVIVLFLSAIPSAVIGACDRIVPVCYSVVRFSHCCQYFDYMLLLLTLSVILRLSRRRTSVVGVTLNSASS